MQQPQNHKAFSTPLFLYSFFDWNLSKKWTLWIIQSQMQSKTNDYVNIKWAFNLSEAW